MSTYFAKHTEHLDPSLFIDEERLRPDVRNSLLTLLYGHLEIKYAQPDSWSLAWLAGSAISYQWQANRDPGDLDVLIGVDYVLFRKTNPTFRGLSDVEISKHLNDGFREDIQPETKEWKSGGTIFEVTFYVNPHSYNIQRINPYAAYLLNGDEWTVHPKTYGDGLGKDTPPEWEAQAKALHAHATTGIARYSDALTRLQNASNLAARVNARGAMHDSLDQVKALFDLVHQGRKKAFSPGGEGYGDMHNFLWQAGKRDGWLKPVRQLVDYRDQLRVRNDMSTYGVELPDTDVLTRRAATAYSTYLD